MHEKTRNLIELHFATFLMGFPPLFAKLIALSPPLIILGRSLFAVGILFVFLKITGQKIILKTKNDFFVLVTLGVLFCIHWVFFFYSVQISTVAVGLIALFTHPIITAFLEPFFFREKRVLTDIINALVVLIGIICIIPEFSLQNNISLGVLFGLISALAFSFRNTVSRKYLQKYSGSVVMFYQISVVALALIPFVFFENFTPSGQDIWLLAILGIVFSAGAHTLFVKSLTSLTAYTVSITESLSVLYGIVLGMMVLSEIPSLRTVLGGIIVLSAVLFETLQHAKGKK